MVITSYMVVIIKVRLISADRTQLNEKAIGLWLWQDKG